MKKVLDDAYGVRILRGMKNANPPALLSHQADALARLAADPAAFVESGTLALLRRRGLVGRVRIVRNGSAKTTSPVLPAGFCSLKPYAACCCRVEEDGDAVLETAAPMFGFGHTEKPRVFSWTVGETAFAAKLI